MHQKMRHRCHVNLISIALLLIWMSFSTTASANSPSEQPLKRTGVLMGLDPGVVLRFNESGEPIFVRLSLRVGGCFTSRIQLGMDWRMDIWAGGDIVSNQTQHEIGPVATFFLIRGWFVRSYVHIGAIHPFVLTSGVATGYEWSMGRFSGGGIQLGGDADIRVDGHAPDGYALLFGFYLTAYDLATRRGRNEF